MALTKAQIAKLQADLKKAEQNLAKAQAAAAKSSATNVDTRATLNKLTSGQTLTEAEKTVLNINKTPEPAAINTIDPRIALNKLTSGKTLTNDEKIRLGITAEPSSNTDTGTDDTGTDDTGTDDTGTDDTGTDDTGTGVGPVKTMAINTFRNTLALFFGKEEVTKPWVNALYGVTSKYYNTGSTIDESLNLALMDARNNKDLEPFTKRFKGLYDLQDKVAAGLAIEAPTIAEFYKSESAMGDVLREAGMSELATQEFLGGVLGLGKSVTEVTNLINTTFESIDNAPDALKKDLQKIAPGADRTAIAKALLLGKEGAAALNKQIAAATVFSASKSQGIGVDGMGIDMTRAADYAARGFGYDASLTGFGEVAKNAAPLQKLTEMGTGKKSSLTAAQDTLSQSIFEKNAAAQEQIRLEGEKEIGRFSGSSGTMGSRSLASRNRANRAI